ncbi:MAG: AsmA family protein [Proteobacteria bacterium]|nr:AsmA family protein [Pseudomonadota bacterium]MDA1291870.1 AsmA family protein [Pseudomonadota bacterium]
MIKTFARLLLGLILLSIVAGVILLMSVNTDQNKAAIQAAVLSSTGYELTIAGDMDIAFFPSVGLTLNDVRLKNPASPQELASTTAALLQVDLRALISGEIFIRELSTDDFHINYYIDALGKSNWDVETPSFSNTTNSDAPLTPSTEQQSNAASTDTNSDIVSVSFERLRINNASIDIQDLSQGLRYSVKNLNLASSNTNIDGNPFDVDVNFTFLNNGMTKPIAMGFRGDIIADINAGNIDIQNISFNVTPMLLQGDLHISGLNDDITFDGSLASNDFDVFGLLQTIGIRETASELDATSMLFSIAENPQASVTASFSGDEFGIKVPELIAQLSESRIEANAEIRFAANLLPANISYEVVSNQIDISPFLDSEVAIDATAVSSNGAATIEPNNIVIATTAPATSTAIPIELLNSFNVFGSIAIESVVANDLLFSGINVFTNIEDGVLDIELQPVATFKGSVAGNIRVDGRSEEAMLSTQLVLSQLNLANLAPSVSRLNSVTGNLDVEVDLTATGQTTNEMMDSLNGSSTFAITENSVDIGVIKQVFTAISALSPTGGTIEQWPDVIRFAELGGFILFNNGLSENQQINMRMDNFDISGTGGIDLQQRDFDYDLQFSILGEPYLQTIQVDELYHDVSWPIECAAAFEDEVNQYCRPDFTRVREIFTQLGTNAVIDRLDEVITDQLPPEVSDGVRGLLRNLLN